jgi:hypothetical protein
VAVKPTLQALVLADQIYTDADTGKRIIAGTFDAFTSPAFPAEYQRHTYAYLSLTGIHGEVPLVLRYVDLSTNEVLLECGPIPISSPDPLRSVDWSVMVPPIPMPHAGAFAFEVHACNELLGSLRIMVELSKAEEAQEGEELHE